MLDDARAEVAALTTRRDEIAEELGRLSGVIEALSVSRRTGVGTPATPARRRRGKMTGTPAPTT